LRSRKVLRIFSVDVLLSTVQCKISVLTYARNSVGLIGDFNGFERVHHPSEYESAVFESRLFLCMAVLLGSTSTFKALITTYFSECH
jgi:hypothetical protein